MPVFALEWKETVTYSLMIDSVDEDSARLALYDVTYNQKDVIEINSEGLDDLSVTKMEAS